MARAPSRHHQGIIKPGEIVEVGSAAPYDRSAWLRARVLALLAAGVPRDPSDDRGDGWWHRPGALPWWEVRQRVGGQVRTAEFAGAVEGLLGDGLVIEAWLRATGRRKMAHVLLLPGHSAALRAGVARARGVAGVLAAEPWYASLGR